MVIESVDLDPCLLAILFNDDCGDSVEVVVKDDLSADFLKGVLDIPAYF